MQVTGKRKESLVLPVNLPMTEAVFWSPFKHAHIALIGADEATNSGSRLLFRPYCLGNDAAT